MTFSFVSTARRAGLFTSAAVVLLLAPSHRVAAQVGYVPAKSPYEDQKPGQSIMLSAGRIGVKRDPAKVAPEASPFLALRYELPIGGPAALYVRYAFAPSERNVFDPARPRVSRLVGTPSVTTHLADIGLDLSLTGQKTWHRLMPSLTGGIGVVSDFASADTGAYQFGTKFSFAYGAGLRYVRRNGWSVRAEATNHIWQYQYPDKYFVVASDTTSILSDTRARSAWRGNWALSVGVSVPIFR